MPNTDGHAAVCFLTMSSILVGLLSIGDIRVVGIVEWACPCLSLLCYLDLMKPLARTMKLGSILGDCRLLLQLPRGVLTVN